MSLPEVLLWDQFRAGKLGFKVRRQHPIGPYVADFFVREAKLLIEVDGTAHDCADRPARDRVRDEYMRERGLRILRIVAIDVMRDLNSVVTLISAHVANPLHHAAQGPPPHAGEDIT